MEINRENYEQYFLDHAEGNLSPEMERKLMDFLGANPDLRSVLEDFDTSPLQTVNIHNEKLKIRLKKSIFPTEHINEVNAEEWLTMDTEGLLDQVEAKELGEFIALNPAYVFDQKLFRLTRLEADPSISFTRKNNLKKKAPVITIKRLVWAASSVAAVIFLFIGIRFFNQPEGIRDPQVTQTEVKSVAETPGLEREDLKIKPDGLKIHEMESRGMESRETPSQILRTASYRMKPSTFSVILSTNKADVTEPGFFIYDLAPVVIAEQKDKPLIAKVFGNLFDRAGHAVRENIDLGIARNTEFNFWSIAEAGVKGYNSLTDRELELLVRRNEKGKIKSYALVQEDHVLVSRNLDKN
jgi:hypothetical protein